MRRGLEIGARPNFLGWEWSRSGHSSQMPSGHPLQVSSSFSASKYSGRLFLIIVPCVGFLFLLCWFCPWGFGQPLQAAWHHKVDATRTCPTCVPSLLLMPGLQTGRTLDSNTWAWLFEFKIRPHTFSVPSCTLHTPHHSNPHNINQHETSTLSDMRPLFGLPLPGRHRPTRQGKSREEKGSLS